VYGRFDFFSPENKKNNGVCSQNKNQEVIQLRIREEQWQIE
jgi:hypothetical protein